MSSMGMSSPLVMMMGTLPPPALWSGHWALEAQTGVQCRQPHHQPRFLHSLTQSGGQAASPAEAAQPDSHSTDCRFAKLAEAAGTVWRMSHSGVTFYSSNEEALPEN